MMEETVNEIPITIQPRSVYGLRVDVVGNIHFTNKQEVIYPVESVLAFHDYETNRQKFLRFPENTSASIIAISPNRKFLAVVEIIDGVNYTVIIYDLLTLKKRKSLQLPNATYMPPIQCLSFTSDSKGIAVLTKPPEETVILFFFDKAETLVQGRASSNNQRGAAECISCNPNDSGLVAVGGENMLKLLARSEKGFTLSSNIKLDDVWVTSIAWVSLDTLIAGTKNSVLMLVESGELKIRLSATETDVIDLSLILEGEEAGEPPEVTTGQLIPGSTSKDESVVCLTSFPKGFAYVIYNTVYVYERESKFRFERKTILKLRGEMYPEKLFQIKNIAINNQQDTIIVTALHSQIYVGVLFVPESLKTRELEFKVLGEPLHVDEIIDLSVCAWKPIIMTASKDQTIRIWNYETERTELVKKYQVQVASIELHPTGILAAIGFSDQLRLMKIFLDDLHIMKTYNFPRCYSAIFSNYGHFMAAAYDNLITIISVFSYEVLKTLKGHNGVIRNVAWSKNDKYLISAGIDGAVYQWDMETGTRIHEVVQKGIEYQDVCLSSDLNSIYVVTNTGILREIHESEIVREVNPECEVPLLSLTLSRSDLVMFMSSAKGHLYNVQLPFLEAGGGKCTNYRFFNSAVTKLKVTYDDTLLITTSASGTLAIWVILNNEGKIASLDQEIGKCEEILIPRKTLVSRNETIASLELRMQQQVDEFQYQLEQSENFHKEKIEELHKSYGDAIKELKDKNEIMEAAHIEELNVITSNIAETKEEHQRVLQEVEAKFHEKLIIEYEKSNNITKRMEKMKDEYEDKLRASAGCLQDTIEALEKDFKNQLQERQNIISQLMQEMDDKKNEFVEYCKQVDIENDRNIVQSQLQYEKKLKNEQEATFKWRGEAGVLRKKCLSMSKENEELRGEIDTLKEEHNKDKRTISNFKRDIDDVRKEIEERDYTIAEKERKISELQRKNIELEKYKQVLTHKITELKAQIEPRERQIKEKRNQIAEMEKELEGLHKNNHQLEIQLAELKDKYHGAEKELRTEKVRARAAREQISRMSSEIYQISNNIQKPDLLKEGIERLHHKYANDMDMRKSVAVDAEIQSEFNRQREHLERIIENSKAKIGQKTESSSLSKLLNENVTLLEELNTLRKQLKAAKKQITNMESILGVGGKLLSAPAARQKLEKACADFDELEKKHRTEMESLQKIIKSLAEENNELRQINN